MARPGHCVLDFGFFALKPVPEWARELGLGYADVAVMFDPTWYKRDEAAHKNLLHDAIFSTLMACESEVVGKAWEDVTGLLNAKFLSVGLRMMGFCGIGRSFTKIQPLRVPFGTSQLPPKKRARIQLDLNKWYLYMDEEWIRYLIVPMNDIRPFIAFDEEQRRVS